jgi:hypothetical protein
MTYRVGDWVEVCSLEEILRTLDDEGAIDKMPFMPEMQQFAGRRLQISASAHKACDTIEYRGNRKIDDAVHLGVRCDGAAHGGCQAACLLYWKTEWLKPVSSPAGQHGPNDSPVGGVNTSVIDRATRISNTDPAAEVRYSCQATRLFEASSPMRGRDISQYWADVSSGNVSVWTMFRYSLLALYNMIVGRLASARTIPSVKGLAGRETPQEVLGLQPGELVEVKSADEIMKTLNAKNSNRGMSFDTEMLPFCGKRYRVKERVERLIDERTGAMLTMKTPGVILESAACRGYFHPGRLFCPRGIYPFWREIWLKRVENTT